MAGETTTVRTGTAESGAAFDSADLARALGWFSIGLGLAELAMPDRLAEMIGVRKNPTLFRLMGVREMAAGLGILLQPNEPAWLWARVGGDMVDLALMGAGRIPGEESKFAAATAAVAGVTALDIYCGRQLSRETAGERNQPLRVRKSVAVNKSPQECYRIWRDFEGLPRFMTHLESVRDLGGNRSHWIAKLPGGATVEWDAEVTNERDGEAIEWRTLEGADVEHSGSVRFEPLPGNKGTLVRLEMEYSQLGGKLASMVAKFVGSEPAYQPESDLRRFKALVETGVVATIDGQPSGRPTNY